MESVFCSAAMLSTRLKAAQPVLAMAKQQLCHVNRLLVPLYGQRGQVLATGFWQQQGNKPPENMKPAMTSKPCCLAEKPLEKLVPAHDTS